MVSLGLFSEGLFQAVSDMLPWLRAACCELGILNTSFAYGEVKECMLLLLAEVTAIQWELTLASQQSEGEKAIMKPGLNG